MGESLTRLGGMDGANTITKLTRAPLPPVKYSYYGVRGGPTWNPQANRKVRGRFTGKTFCSGSVGGKPLGHYCTSHTRLSPPTLPPPFIHPKP